MNQLLVTIDLAAWHHRDRIARIAALTQQDTTAGLIWLALRYPAICDAMLDKIEWDGIDDEDPAQRPPDWYFLNPDLPIPDAAKQRGGIGTRSVPSSTSRMGQGSIGTWRRTIS